MYSIAWCHPIFLIYQSYSTNMCKLRHTNLKHTSHTQIFSSIKLIIPNKSSDNKSSSKVKKATNFNASAHQDWSDNHSIILDIVSKANELMSWIKKKKSEIKSNKHLNNRLKELKLCLTEIHKADYFYKRQIQIM